MFRSVLVATRGEIAVRVVRTLRRLGVRAVVVASIPDRHSLAVRNADDWVLLEGYSAAETYLDGPAVVRAALAHGCEAIHPGYGFLSERAEFAEACAAARLTFVGPPPAVLRTLGDKSAARQLARSVGVPVVPGWDGADDDATLDREAARLGYPVMVKARGGGGGRGMREVLTAAELPDALASARREALAAFGDAGLLLEKLVRDAHHVEVQILADAHGHVVHLGERDCSVQRRRQKLIEETPSPVVDEELRQALTGAALRLARAAGYVNAGTVEFLVPTASHGRAATGDFYFLEVNPRLQVEHPVTEMVSGLDLVELQLRVAAGETLPVRQEDMRLRGHAIEFRLNAEDPWNGFRPSAGRVVTLECAADRVDTGYLAGDTVPAQYDSLLAKVVVAGADRAAALWAAAADLAETEMAGVTTNLALHRAILATPAFRARTAGVRWLEETFPELPEPLTADRLWLGAAAALLFAGRDAVRAGGGTFWLSDGRETRLCGGRRDHVARTATVSAGARETSVRLLADEAGQRDRGAVDSLALAVEDGAGTVLARVERLADGHTRLTVHDRAADGASSARFRLVPPPPLPRRDRGPVAGATAVAAPLSGTVADVRAREGEAVEHGALLVVLEAMKMEHRVVASTAGTVLRVAVRVGDVVHEGDVLVELSGGHAS
ncbi:MAG: ATP-grasp domain-containing protein [Dehalococcoidia bacterium]|nr:ATP-grasp domain-containing protein [Dehalococcoidia bacterium]